MKSSIVIFGSLVALQAMVGVPLHSDAYDLFLAERENANFHSYAYLEGSSKEKITEDKQFTLLNYIAKEAKELSEEILEHDADIVCLQRIASHEMGYRYYSALKDKYAHFYVETCDTGISLVASKYQMRSLF